MKEIKMPTINRLKNHLFALIILMVTCFTGFSQNVGINTTGTAPNAEAGLDVDFPNKGVLIPRVALTGTANFAPLSAHVAGMMVYNTANVGDVTAGLYYNNGSKWIPGKMDGNSVGSILYWNGTDWATIASGTVGQHLQLDASSIPYWAAGAIKATLTTNAMTLITGTTATSGASGISDGGSTIITRGICYATTANPTTGSLTVAAAPIGGNANYSCNLTALSYGTIYYVRAYAINNSVVSYGNELTFPTLAAVNTAAATLITTNSARTSGTVTSGNAPVLERGVCYATTQTPTTSNIKLPYSTPGTGTFITDITGLAENTLYYARSYVINASGTNYGTQISITTLPTLTTAAISGITQIAASSGGTIAVGGNAAITARGVCWSTSTSPTTALTTKTTNATGTGVFTSSITPLIAGTTYYVRAYATNAGGTSYGDELSFNTLPAAFATLTTTAVAYNITTTSAQCDGNVSNDGGVPVTSKGVCWSTSSSPTIANSFYHYYTGTGALLGYLTLLTPNTLYYVRAYATNSVGTAYGNEVTFTTCSTPQYSIGQSYGGGYVFYVDCSGIHGLIMATVSQGSPSGGWGCSGTLMNTSTAFGTGAANTTAILAGCTTRPIAASLARDYRGGGFTDWYLPSREELNKMTQCIFFTTSGLGYFSSSENGTMVYSYYYGNNWQSSPLQKTNTTGLVRAIRSF